MTYKKSGSLLESCILHGILLLALLVLPAYLPCQDVLVRKVNDFSIDGKGMNPAWQSTEWEEIPQRRIDGKKYQTRVKLAYSETGMYFLFECEDSLITSTMENDFDDLWKEDVVEVFLWTDENLPIYFEYELSPRNIELPILVPNVNGTFLGWRPWNYEGERKVIHETCIVKDEMKVTAWIAEFYIPYALLKPLANVPPESGMKWRINMYRVDYDQGVSNWAWKPIRTNFHDYERFGVIEFE